MRRSYLLNRAHRRWSRFALPVPLTVFFGAETSSFGITHVPLTGAMLVAGTQIQSGSRTGVILGFGKLPA
jgi:hypothetical protein